VPLALLSCVTFVFIAFICITELYCLCSQINDDDDDSRSSLVPVFVAEIMVPLTLITVFILV